MDYIKSIFFRINKGITLFMLLLLFSTCTKKIIGEDENLSLTRVNYEGNQLKLNGYYYLQKDTKIFDSYFFYTNGVLINGGAAGDNPNSLSCLDKLFSSPDYYANIQKSKTHWGLFKIEGNAIYIEKWYAGNGPLQCHIKIGEIINDSTFKITSSHRSNGTEERIRDEVYRFRPFSPKPDSSNTFVN